MHFAGIIMLVAYKANPILICVAGRGEDRIGVFFVILQSERAHQLNSRRRLFVNT